MRNKKIHFLFRGDAKWRYKFMLKVGPVLSVMRYRALGVEGGVR